MIKVIVFDMDGVLSDSNLWHINALDKALSLFGCDLSQLNCQVSFDSMTTKDKLNIVTLKTKLPIGLHKFIYDLKQIYLLDIINSKCKPIFCHQFALARLKQEGYKIVLASNSNRNIIDIMMAKANLNNFDFIISSDDVLKPKPDPEIYIKVIEKLNVKPEQVLIIEDDYNNIQAAELIGANTLYVKSIYDVNYLNIKQTIEGLN